MTPGSVPTRRRRQALIAHQSQLDSSIASCLCSNSSSCVHSSPVSGVTFIASDSSQLFEHNSGTMSVAAESSNAMQQQQHQQQPVASTSAAAGQASSEQATGARPSSKHRHSSSSSAGARAKAGSAQSHHHSHSNTSARSRGTLGTAGRPPHHRQALSAIRAFLRRESCFDILPESFRLIVLDNKLLIKRALVALQTNGAESLSGL